MSIYSEEQGTLLSSADELLRQRINRATLWCACLLCGTLAVMLARQVPAGAWGTFLLALPLAVLLGLPLATLLHEGVHALALRSLGYRARLRFTSFYPPLAYAELTALYFIAWKIIVAALAPVVVVTVVAVALVLSNLHWQLSLVALVVLGTNMLGSATDVGIAVFLTRVPPASILLPFDLPPQYAPMCPE